MIEYIKTIILLYVQDRCKELELLVDQAALAIFDVFNSQRIEGIVRIVEEITIHFVSVPANCTDRLQPVDLSVSKSMKECMGTEVL